MAASCSSHWLLRLLSPASHAFPQSSVLAFPATTLSGTAPCLQRQKLSSMRTIFTVVAAKGSSAEVKVEIKKSSPGAKKEVKEEEEEEEVVEEELPWIQEKAIDFVEFTGSVTQAIPGPRVGGSSLPWLLAVPLAYMGITFLVALIKTVRNFNTPKEKRRKLVNKNAMLCKTVDELFQKGRDEVKQSALKGLMQKTGFNMEEILRKYIRYALNEKPFNAEVVANLICLRKASMLDDSQVAETLNDISRRIVRDKASLTFTGLELWLSNLSETEKADLAQKSDSDHFYTGPDTLGPVVMDASGYSEKGFKRKLAVQALFSKVLYLSELPEFCLRDSSLTVKEIFGVTDDDADKIRIHTLAEVGDVDSLRKMVDAPYIEASPEGLSSDAPQGGDSDVDES